MFTELFSIKCQITVINMSIFVLVRHLSQKTTFKMEIFEAKLFTFLKLLHAKFTISISIDKNSTQGIYLKIGAYLLKK